MRFRKSVRLAPGLRLNFSGSGASLTAGPRGASVSFGSRGVYLNSGIPGTGLYSRSRLAISARPAAQPAPPGKVSVKASVTVEDDGTVLFNDADGNPLSDSLTNRAKRQHGEDIRRMLAEVCDRINAEREALATIHAFTPPPDDIPTLTPESFGLEEPTRPEPHALGMLDRIFGRRAKFEAEFEAALKGYERDLKEWEYKKATFLRAAAAKCAEFDSRLRTDVAFMQQVFEDNLLDISWPRETAVSFQASDDGAAISIDVDLPEIEDLPSRVATLPDRGYKLRLKELKTKELQELYLRHVHAIGFRVIGEAFATLPAVMEVTLSAFTQRAAGSTGHVGDVYVYSVKMPRDGWSLLNFQNLSAIDPVATFERFYLRRKIGKSGRLEQIEPIA